MEDHWVPVWAPGWPQRVQTKVAAAVLATTVGSAVSAQRHGIPVTQQLPTHLVGYTGAMALFCGVQESLRALRGGHHDAWNSGVAGAVAGSLVAWKYQGPQYRLLAAVMWGPLCGAAHLLNEWVRPRYLVEDALIADGLLSPQVAERRPLAHRLRSLSEPEDVYRVYKDRQGGIQGVTSDSEIMRQAEVIREREMAALASNMGMHQQQRARRGAPSVPITTPPSSGSTTSTSSPANSTPTGTSSMPQPTELQQQQQQQQQGPAQKGWWPWQWFRRRQPSAPHPGEGDVEGRAGTASASAAAADQSSGTLQGSRGSKQQEVLRSGSRAQQQAKPEQEREVDEEDEEDFKAWLAMQSTTAEGLVVVGGAGQQS